MIQRRTPLKRTAMKRNRSPIRKRSKKGASQDRIYTKLKKQLLEEHPVCQVCDTKRATDCHHTKGRGVNFLNYPSFKAVCRSCHDRIHQNPSWARANGLLV